MTKTPRAAAWLAAIALALIVQPASAQTQPVPSALGPGGSYLATSPTAIVIAPAGGASGPGTVVATDKPFPTTNTPGTATSTRVSPATVTTGGTYQTAFAASTTRKGCLIQNPTTATEILSVRVGGTIVYTVPIGAVFNCASPSGIVISDLIEVTAATTSHAFDGASQ